MHSEREQLVAALHQLAAAGLSPGASGNASVRADGGMWISASGISAEQSTVDNLVFIDHRIGDTRGRHKPSSEWLMHRRIYDHYPQTGAIVHCHSRYATALACQRRTIPAFHYMVAVAGGDDVPCADYAEFGTEALALAVCKSLQQRSGCLMANHGQIATAACPARAAALASDIEELAAMYYLSLQHGGPVLLSADEMAAVLKRFKSYGQR